MELGHAGTRFDYRKWFVLISPLLIILIGHLSARLFSALLGQWAGVGVELVYWGSMILVTAALVDRQRVKGWFARPRGSRWWIVAAVTMGFISFPFLFIPHFRVMTSIPLILAWFLFAVINSTLEETYWRGCLLDETSRWPRAFGVIYSSLLFSAIHPLMLGVFSKAQAIDPADPMRFLPFGVILIILSLFYCLLYLKTKSLVLPVISHFLTDLGNLSIFVFMNMIVV